MKHLIYLFLVVSQLVYGQYNFDFENGNLDAWSQYPGDRWEITFLGDTMHLLHHAFDNTEAGTDIIGMKLLSVDLSDTLTIAFRLRHGYNPSSGNNWQCIILADSLQENWSAKESSAFLFGVNYTGSDDMLCLWQQTPGKCEELVSTGFNVQERIGTEDLTGFLLQRTPDGQWNIYMDDEERLLLGSGIEGSELVGRYFGFRYSYSSAQDRKLWIDDIRMEGSFYKDTLPPEIRAVRVIGSNRITVDFNEAVSSDGISSFRWGKSNPDSVSGKGSEISLFFSREIPNRKEQELTVNAIADREGNRMSDTIVGFYADRAEFGDIVINEIMFDPEPAIYLPESEYVELYNTYTDTIELEKWTFRINSKAYMIRSSILPPDSYLLLCAEGNASGFTSERTCELWTSNTSLPNSGAELVLTDSAGILIHRMKYEEIQFYDAYKAEGGWSLEQFDAGYLCGGEENWFMSQSSQGGTPGKKNSLSGRVSDIEIPEVKYIGVDESGVFLSFSESVFVSEAGGTTFSLNSEQYYADFATSPLLNEKLFIPAYLDSSSIYTLEIDSLQDCSGNILEDYSIGFGWPVLPEFEDLRINEIMFDPLPGGNEYIELLNSTEKTLDLYDLKYSLADNDSMNTLLYELSQEHHLLFPGEYVVFCKKEYLLREEWDLNYAIDVVCVENWKQLPNDASCITICDRSGKTIDRFCYDAEMHHDILADHSGVALERLFPGSCVSPDQCWQSASSIAGYGTPGYRNSQWAINANEEMRISVYPQVFSPDQDGRDDFLEISIPAGFAGGSISVFITDLYGNMVKELILDGIVGRGDHLFWDGQDMNKRIVLPGIYIVHAFISSTTGSYSERKSCALRY